MNNQDFKKLLLTTSAGAQNGTGSTPRPGATPGGSLGSRQRSSIPMTPRTVRGSTGIDFQRQLAEQRAADQPARKFRSSAAPKGSKLATGYTDRTQDRFDEESDDLARRVKALEESMKLGQIDQETFEKLRDQITGGDVGATHLVKGLDRQLLERVRRGEDVLGVGGGNKGAGAAQKEPSPDVDEEFEKLEEKEIAPVVKEKKDKKGQTAIAGTKRTRDAILAEFKAQRKAAAEAKAAAQPQLGSKFKRIGAQTQTYPRIERDDRGREVLITLDEDGNVKRKIRKVKAEADVDKAPSGLLMPDKDAKPLGMEVPELPPAPVEEDDVDIFDDVGDDYDPLAGLGDDDTSSSEDEDGEVKASNKPESTTPKDASESPSSESEKEPASAAMPPPPKPSETVSMPKTNYFNDKPSTDNSTPTGPPSNPLTDPTILAAIRKARDINPEKLKDDEDSAPTSAEEEARLKRRAAMLAPQDRDFEDMDMGFGSSRFDDAEDLEEGTKIKLSEWKGTNADGDDDGEGAKDRGGGKKRKRGPKKRKGDKDSAADVLRVMEQRKSNGK